jgi:pimeloyl-ACP methyl ester carboxylesterase
VVYGVVLALMYTMQRSLMYFPNQTRTPPAAAGLPQAQEVTLDTADGEKVIAWHVPPAEGKWLVVYFHGNGGSLSWRAHRFERVVADGTGLLALSYRGYGGSTGSPSETGLIADAEAAYAFAARNGADRIALWGESLGTGVATAIASERKVGRLILESPFTSAADVAAAKYPFLPARWLIKDSFRSDLRIAKVTAPVLVLHGARDNVVPIEYGERLYAMIPGRKKFVRLETARHNDHDQYGAVTIIQQFLADGAD